MSDLHFAMMKNDVLSELDKFYDADHPKRSLELIIDYLIKCKRGGKIDVAWQRYGFENEFDQVRADNDYSLSPKDKEIVLSEALKNRMASYEAESNQNLQASVAEKQRLLAASETEHTLIKELNSLISDLQRIGSRNPRAAHIADDLSSNRPGALQRFKDKIRSMEEEYLTQMMAKKGRFLGTIKKQLPSQDYQLHEAFSSFEREVDGLIKEGISTAVKKEQTPFKKYLIIDEMLKNNEHSVLRGIQCKIKEAAKTRFAFAPEMITIIKNLLLILTLPVGAGLIVGAYNYRHTGHFFFQSNASKIQEGLGNEVDAIFSTEAPALN